MLSVHDLHEDQDNICASLLPLHAVLVGKLHETFEMLVIAAKTAIVYRSKSVKTEFQNLPPISDQSIKHSQTKAEGLQLKFTQISGIASRAH